MAEIVIRTTRLILRHWKREDEKPYIQMNADAEVMRFFPSVLSTEQTQKSLERIEEHFKKYGFGFYAVERRDNTQFIGFIGLAHPGFKSYFTPCVEIGWRLSLGNWGQGFATEGAKACLEYAFNNLGFTKVYSFTSILNLPSISVMKKVGMKFEGEFEHPLIEDGHRLKPHVLYKIENREADNTNSNG